jgi:Tol biopolymer transport system component
MLGEPVEIDAESGAEVYLIGPDERPADNIYGEQPYADPTSRRIAIRYYPHEGEPGGIEIVDLYDGSRHEVLAEKPLFPPFHAWGEYFYFRQRGENGQMLRRCRYDAPEQVKDIALLPPERGRYSYGTVSPDHRYYAVAVRPEGADRSRVDLLNIATGQWRVLLDKETHHAKHEQFSRDGRNRILIQLNEEPDWKHVLLGEIDLSGELKLFPADEPHTLRPTGHEAWQGDRSSIFFSTKPDPEISTNIWTGAVGDGAPTPVTGPDRRIGHVSVSADGRYWIGDTGEDGRPLYVGSFASGKFKRAVFSRTEYDGNQWAHAHPYMTADNRWLIFSARREGGHPQVYGAKLAEGWLDSLDE